MTSITARLVFVSSAATAVLVGGLAVPILTTVYGSAFASAAGALRWLLVGVVSLSVSRVLANSIAAIGEPGKNVMGSLVALVSNVVLNVLLIPRFGIGGAAVASAVTYSMTLAHRLWVYRRVCGRSVRVLDYLVPRREDVALVRDSVLPRLRS